MRQHRQVFSGPIVLIEGPADKRVLEPHLAEAALFPADGRNNVLRAAEQLHEWGLSLYVGIIDADFGPEDQSSNHGSVICYEKRDLEAMLIELGVLGSLLDHLGSTVKIAAAGGSDVVVSKFIDVAAAISALRSANAREGWGLNFDEVDLASKIDPSTLELKAIGYCMALRAASHASVTVNELKGVVLDPEFEDELGPRGKDVLAIAGVALRRSLGSLPAQAADHEMLTRDLHLGAGFALSRSGWLQSLRDMLGLASE